MDASLMMEEKKKEASFELTPSLNFEESYESSLPFLGNMCQLKIENVEDDAFRNVVLACSQGNGLSVYNTLGDDVKNGIANFPDAQGFYLIHWAAKLGDVGLFSALFKNQEIQWDDSNSYLPIHLASAYGHFKLLKNCRPQLLGVDLGDKRLERKSFKLLENLGSNPSANLPEACGGWSETKAAYRFFENKSVNGEKILQPHKASTIKRMSQHKVVLLIQDTTQLNYSTQS